MFPLTRCFWSRCGAVRHVAPWWVSCTRLKFGFWHPGISDIPAGQTVFHMWYGNEHRTLASSAQASKVRVTEETPWSPRQQIHGVTRVPDLVGLTLAWVGPTCTFTRARRGQCLPSPRPGRWSPRSRGPSRTRSTPAYRPLHGLPFMAEQGLNVWKVMALSAPEQRLKWKIMSCSCKEEGRMKSMYPQVTP